MRQHGPLLMHVYGVDEDIVLREWTVAKFHYYRDFALELMKARRGGA